MKLGDFSADLHTEPGRGMALLPEQFKAFLIFLQIMLEEVLHWFTTPVEVLVRRKFGCRWASSVLVSQLFVLALVGIPVAWVTLDPLFGAFAFAPALVSIHRLREARRWEREGSPWRHSYYRGEPVPALWEFVGGVLARLGFDPARLLTTTRVNRFAQPALCLVVGFAVLPFSRILGFYLLGAAPALFLKATLIHNRIVNMIRDQKDAMVTGEWMSGVTSQSVSGTEERVFEVKVVMPLPPTAPEPLPVPLPKRPRVSLRCPGCHSRLLASTTGRARSRPCPKCGTEINTPATVEAVC